jgi:hypothetical protein
MIRPPDWSLDEFIIVLANPGMPPAKLIPQLPGRTGGAIGVVQQGIHAFHKGTNISTLSRLMVDHLETHRGSLVCPVCRWRF